MGRVLKKSEMWWQIANVTKSEYIDKLDMGFFIFAMFDDFSKLNFSVQ